VEKHFIWRVIEMNAKFDIFLKLPPDGNPIWIKAVDTLEEARHQVLRITEEAPGDYFIYNARNGQVMAAEA
jgi:hypothetical protein